MTMSTPADIQNTSVQYLRELIKDRTGIEYSNMQLGIITTNPQDKEELDEEQFTDLDSQRVGIKPFFISKGDFCSF